MTASADEQLRQQINLAATRVSGQVEAYHADLQRSGRHLPAADVAEGLSCLKAVQTALSGLKAAIGSGDVQR